MATLEAIVGGDSLVLSDGAPYKLLDARGLSGAPVRRVADQGPDEFGHTDRGYRLGPREIELDIGFRADSNSALDDHRRALVSHFKPLSDTAINLRYTRDDAVVRQIDCFTVGKIKIGLVKEHRPGHYHKASIRLYAPDPAFYNPVPGTVSLQGVVAPIYLQGTAINYAGDLDERPIIRVTGPITNPVVRSAYTNDDLTFTGVTIGAGTTYIIDTRVDRKTVYAGTINKIGELSDSSDLGSFSIVPAASQGINVFYLGGNNTGTATLMEIVYYTRYLSI